MGNLQNARELLGQFKGRDYFFGRNVPSQVKPMAGRLGNKALIVRCTFPGSEESAAILRTSLADDSLRPILEAAKTGDLGLIKNLQESA